MYPHFPLELTLQGASQVQLMSELSRRVQGGVLRLLIFSEAFAILAHAVTAERHHITKANLAEKVNARQVQGQPCLPHSILFWSW